MQLEISTRDKLNTCKTNAAFILPGKNYKAQVSECMENLEDKFCSSIE